MHIHTHMHTHTHTCTRTHTHTRIHTHTHTHTTVLPKLDLSHNQLADDLSSTASSISLLKPLPDSAFLAGSRLESIMLSIIILWE